MVQFAAQAIPDLALSPDITDVPQLSLCWCESNSSCAASQFNSELAKLVFRGPARGVEHECTHDSTCLMSIKDIPGMGSLSFTSQLIILADCTG